MQEHLNEQLWIISQFLNFLNLYFEYITRFTVTSSIAKGTGTHVGVDLIRTRSIIHTWVTNTIINICENITHFIVNIHLERN